ncbi:hypothetical protein [Aeromonas veronii]|uniref:hypothetical protein n=1 Tax=Aeromonas TaxID=642 RepID=UPI00214D8AE8|nr:hypothetical protein [Aeromonas veronii]MCR3966772.1 hypothetical protein [Aeromonas veronii]MCR3979316.1 hypothetical protein [Aeromonas veronii]MCS0539569.1 hypothetical protein [Aeromonas veronii]
MKKYYNKPTIFADIGKVGLPTVLAIGAVSAAVGAASVAVGRMVGKIDTQQKNHNFKSTCTSHLTIKGFA